MGYETGIGGFCWVGPLALIRNSLGNCNLLIINQNPGISRIFTKTVFLILESPPNIKDQSTKMHLFEILAISTKNYKQTFGKLFIVLSSRLHQQLLLEIDNG